MGPTSDQLERQIDEVRGRMESRVIELRDLGLRIDAVFEHDHVRRDDVRIGAWDQYPGDRDDEGGARERQETHRSM